MSRASRLMPNGIPRYIRCYDNGGKTFDRYTIVYTGRYTHRTNGAHLYVGASAHPFHPQGFGQHGEAPNVIDRPRYSHLGKRVRFGLLPENVRTLVLQDYREIWAIK
jgi:hypothetical protein